MESLSDCRLYLPVPATSLDGLEGALAELSNIEIASILLVGEANEQSRESIFRLRDLALRHEAAFLVDGDLELAKEIEADGVHLAPDPNLYRQARDALGQRAVIGVGSVDSRHMAMVLAELGADYVAFGPASDRAPVLDRGDWGDLIAWWSEIMVVPCVAFDVETAEEAGKLAELGADFIAPSPSIWRRAGAINEILAIYEAIEGGRSVP
jgi:thiamine-phosphate pyrophosphorylase